MATHEIPRNVKGEGRFLYIFSTKSLIYTVALGIVGLLFYALFNMLGLKTVGLIFVAVFALVGFCIGTFKVPEIESFSFTKKTGGENIDDVIKRGVKFKLKKNRIYVYTKEEKE